MLVGDTAIGYPPSLASDSSAAILPTYSVFEPVDFHSIMERDSWRSIPSVQGRSAAFGITQELIESMSTYALLRTVVEYPFALTMLSAECIRRAFLIHVELIPGFYDLVARVDFGPVLIEHYRSLSVKAPVHIEYYRDIPLSAIGIDHFPNFDLWLLEAILVQPEFSGVLSIDELRTIAQTAEEKAIEKIEAFPNAVSSLMAFHFFMTRVDSSPFWAVIESITFPFYLQMCRLPVITYKAHETAVAPEATPRSDMVSFRRR